MKNVVFCAFCGLVGADVASTIVATIIRATAGTVSLSPQSAIFLLPKISAPAFSGLMRVFLLSGALVGLLVGWKRKLYVNLIWYLVPAIVLGLSMAVRSSQLHNLWMQGL